MEIPDDIKSLYNHWQFHIGSGEGLITPENVFKDEKLFRDIEKFINERITIWSKKISGKHAPYTQDPILSKYRFCNIFREFDRQTIDFHKMLNPLRKNFDLWLLNMFYCRMVARPETIQKTGLLSFDKENNDLVYKKLLDLQSPKYGTPYVFPVSVIMKSKTPNRELFITKHLPSVIKDVSAEIQSWNKNSVYEGVKKVLPIFGFNLKFLWTEVLIDVAYQFPQFINLFDKFPIGPGALPTFKKIDCGKDPESLALELSKVSLDTSITFNGKKLRLSTENWEGVGCEYRKYTNLKIGKGRKRLYN